MNVYKKIFISSVIALYTSFLTFNVQAEENSNDPLQDFLKGFKSLEANFVQSLINENGQVLEKTEGILFLQQPGKFHWSYQTPYTQLIISNGDVLWLYDEDLEQLTIRKMGDAINQTPAGIILGNNNITEHFLQVDMGNIENHDWIELTPKDPEAQYKNIRIGFDGTKLGMMIIFDNLGQTTRIDFSDVKKNTNLLPTLFEFDIPEGVDVIDETKVDEVSESNS